MYERPTQKLSLGFISLIIFLGLTAVVDFGWVSVPAFVLGIFAAASAVLIAVRA